MNVADFQQNKTMMRQHTHDFIKNTSKPRISRGGSGKGNNRAPAKKTESQKEPKSGVNVNLFFGGGRSALNDLNESQYLSQGIGIQQQGGNSVSLSDMTSILHQHSQENKALIQQMQNNPHNTNLINDLNKQMMALWSGLQQDIAYTADETRKNLNESMTRNAEAIRKAVDVSGALNNAYVEGGLDFFGKDVADRFTNASASTRKIQDDVDNLTLMSLPAKQGGSKGEKKNLQKYVADGMSDKMLAEPQEEYIKSVQQGLKEVGKEEEPKETGKEPKETGRSSILNTPFRKPRVSEIQSGAQTRQPPRKPRVSESLYTPPTRPSLKTPKPSDNEVAIYRPSIVATSQPTFCKFGTIFQSDDEESDSSGTVYNVDIPDDGNVTNRDFLYWLLLLLHD